MTDSALASGDDAMSGDIPSIADLQLPDVVVDYLELLGDGERAELPPGVVDFMYGTLRDPAPQFAAPAPGDSADSVALMKAAGKASVPRGIVKRPARQRDGLSP